MTTISEVTQKRNYLEERDNYAKKMHSIRKSLFLAMKRLRAQEVSCLNSFAHLYEIFFALENLNTRVKDPTIFEVAEREFKDLSFSLSNAFSLLGHKKSAEEALQVFSTSIENFEAMYSDALQIVAPDPLVFLFFIQDLLALQEQLLLLNQKLSVLK